MKAILAAWLVNPVTLALTGAVLTGFFVVIELLLSSLARFGNVRFQGIIEDHPGVLTQVVDQDTHLSKVTDILRWIEIAALGLLWLVIDQLPWAETWHRVATAMVVTGVLILAARISAGSLSEDSVARLLRLVFPIVGPLLRTLGGNGKAIGTVACNNSAPVHRYYALIKDKTLSRWEVPPDTPSGEEVKLRFELDASGSATKVEFIRATSPALGDSAVRALRESSPFPAMNDAVRGCLADTPLRAKFSVPAA